MIYVLITNNYATLKELRDEYTIEETLDLYEMCLTNLYNKNQIQEEVKNHGRDV